MNNSRQIPVTDALAPSANTGCAGCAGFCLDLRPAAGSEPPLTVTSTALLQLVAWLFGAPLLVLLAAVWGIETLLQSQPPMMRPLWSLLFLSGIGGMVFVLARRSSDKLLNMVQPQRTAPDGELD